MLFQALAIFGAAAAIRMLVLFLITGPDESGIGWFMDAFHHWQVAYLSKEIGFAQGFLRLWDFKGMEYFWGLMHPLLAASLFSATGSIDILIPRLLTLVSGSMSAVLLFFLARRYFNLHVAIATALLTAINPVIVLSDGSGMQEPLGIALLLFGLLLWPKQPIAAGILLGCAGMVRAEYWVFGVGLGIAAVVMDRKNYGSWGLILGWAIPSIFYMKYLLDYTGNAIYPVYWYFLGDAAGQWMGEGSLSPAVEIATITSRAALPLLLAAAAWVLIKKPRHALLFLLGIGELIFLCAVFGFTAFGRGFLPYLLLDRIFLLPHLYLGLFLSIFMLGGSSGRGRQFPLLAVRWMAIVGIAVAIQWLWSPILKEFERWRPIWHEHFQAADEIAGLHEGGTISLPEDRPEFTYALARYHGIPAELIEGQKYDPFAYMDGDPFAAWPQTEKALSEWLVSQDIHLLAFYTNKNHYKEMIRRMPDRFDYAGSVLDGRIDIYRVYPEGKPPGANEAIMP